MQFKNWLIIKESNEYNAAINIAKDAISHINCNSLGVCMLATELITKKLVENGINNFTIIEGYVKGKQWHSKDAHTWIELDNIEKEIIDPTLKQFNQIGGGPFKRIGPYKRYTPQQYIELCKKYPNPQEDINKHLIKKNPDEI